jgi:hypothetical protein
VTHLYPAEGVYSAVVTASNTVGEQAATTTVTVIIPKTVSLPLVMRGR